MFPFYNSVLLMRIGKAELSITIFNVLTECMQNEKKGKTETDREKDIILS